MSLLRSTATVGGLTLVSRVLGFVRDVVLAGVFGAGAATDAFFVAFKIPNFLRRLFAEGAFAQAFVPVLAEYKAQRSLAEVRVLVTHAAGTLGGTLLLLTVLAVLGSPGLVFLFAPGFSDDPQRFALTEQMLRVTFPYLLLISLTALAGSVLNTYGRFAVPALTPVWLNLVLIATALWGSGWFEPSIVALAWGVFAAGVVQLCFQLPFLAREGLLAWPRWGWGDAGVRRVLRLMLPAIFGSSVAQINLLLDTVIASFLAAGSVSWLYYSDRLVEFPLGVFGIALATVILPSLSQRHAEADPRAFAATLDWGLRWVLLIGTPASLGLILLAEPLIATLFQYGAFGDHDVRMAGLSLTAYGAGLLGFMLVKVLAPGYFARQDTKTPVRIGIYAMLMNMLLNVAFVVPMALAGVEGPHAGLALATSAAAFANAGMLFRGLSRAGVYRAEPGWARLALQLLLANGALLAWLVFGSGSTDAWLGMAPLDRVLRLMVLVVGGIAVYFGVLLAAGVRPRQLLGRAGDIRPRP